jgi:hypothetical protein
MSDGKTVLQVIGNSSFVMWGQFVILSIFPATSSLSTYLPYQSSKMATEQEIDSLVDAFSASGSGAGPSTKKEVTYADFEKMLSETPLFMQSTPEGMEDNEVLQGLRSLVFEGEGDGK